MALKPLKQPGWPAPHEVLEEGRQFLRDAALEPGAVVAARRDVDGLASGALVVHTFEALESGAPRAAFPARGEHSHAPSFRARLRKMGPTSLVVLAMGSRGGTLLRGVPTLVVDHHRPEGTPSGALWVSSSGAPPVAPTALLTYFLVSPMATQAKLEWLALLGAVAELGPDAPFPGTKDALKRHGRVALVDTIALLNAARRAEAFDAGLALRVLLEADTPGDIARGRVEGVARLRELRDSVQAELSRCARATPRLAGRVALLTVHTGAQIHPLLATRWAQRLPELVVMVANTGYQPGAVHFAVRSRAEPDLLAFLGKLGVPGLERDALQGHARAVGGRLDSEAFVALLRALGFGRAEAERGAGTPA
ncbi:MAG: hypothetical protein L0Y66_07915 [Myxococcaceae bacterium]|nr:hypothetical protein [Myxococcaceae bacterium]